MEILLGWTAQFRYDTGSGDLQSNCPSRDLGSLPPQNGFDDGAVCDNSVLNGIPGGCYTYPWNGRE